jgi:hypothetical protein
MLKVDIINEIKKKQMPVIICGAGIVGRVLLSICKDEGITVECFCDSSKKVAQSSFCDMEIIYTPDLKTKYKDAIFLISVAAIKDVVDLLHDLGFTNWYAGGLLLKDLDVSQGHLEASIDYTKYAIENCILCHDGYLNPNQLFLRSIDLIITERCSLKCRDCSNLMQYYEKPKDCDIDMLLKSIDVFCAVIDKVMDFRVIGGDAFMNKEWPIIVKRLTDEPKAKRVVVYTNGTIVPNEKDIPYLINDKVLIIITDYGVLSRKLVGLKQMLEKNKIAYYVLKVTEWLDCSKITPHNRNIDQNREIYKICCAKNMATLSDGKLFRCPYAANAARLSAVPDYKNDYIDLFQEPLDAASIRETKNKVRNYLLHKDYLKTCDYCNGRPLSGPEVQPAIQADKPLTYHKYVVE